VPQLAVTPAVLDFPCTAGVASATVHVTNLNKTGPLSIRIKPPATRWFKLRGAEQTQRIAPGLQFAFEVCAASAARCTCNNQQHSFSGMAKTCMQASVASMLSNDSKRCSPVVASHMS
jgi:hypothetical protein